MDGTRFRAGIELYGRVMRYAELELGARGDGAAPPRLLRLGACDFDFDVAEALLDLSGPTHLDTIATAIREIFSGSRAEALHVAVHPWWSTSFFSPIPEGAAPADRLEQVRQEAAMLSDAAVSRPVRVKVTPVRIEVRPDGRRSHWHHVLRLPEAVHARLVHVAKPLGGADGEGGHEALDTTGAAAAVMARLARTPAADTDDAFALAVGVYDGRTEFALTRGEAWYYGHHAEAGIQDSTYYAAALLDRLGVEPHRVRHLFLYGDAAEAGMVDSLSDFLDVEAEPLNPLRLFRLAPSEASPYALAAYAPCVGALLR